MTGESSVVIEQTVKEHEKLVVLIDSLLEAFNKLPTDIEWPEVQWLPDSEILDFIRIQAISLQNAKESIMRGFYRDAYHLIRMVFEAYFLLRLISTCEKYPRRIKLRQAEGDPNLEFTKQRVFKQLGKIHDKRLVKIYEESKNILIAVVKVAPVKDDKGRDTDYIVPFYYNAWRQYRPIEHHVKRGSTLRFLEGEWSIMPKRSRLKEDKSNRQLYNWFLSFGSMLDNLQLNGVLNMKTSTRVIVHYNFLSNFSHSTSDSIKNLLRLEYHYMVGGGGALISYNHYYSELALLYTCHLLSMYLEHAIYYLTKWRHIPVKSDRFYYSMCQKVEDDFGYFWFIFNKPHEYDRFAHANRKCNYKKKRFYCPEDIRLIDVRYYEDPLYRLKQMHQSFHEITTGNIFNSPFPRADALR